MTRTPFLLTAISLATTSPAPAQAPRVPVPVRGADPVADFGCSTATIYNLQGTDGFLSVRAGPSRRERELARLHDGDPVFACVRRGDWFGIVFAPPGSSQDCDVLQARPAARDYAGPCRSGWVHHRHIGGYADWISP